MPNVKDCPGFETFGADVQQARDAVKMSRRELAEKVGIDPRYLANIAGYAFRWSAFSIAQTMDSTGQNPHQEQAAGGRCFALLTRFPSCAGEQTRGKAAAGFPSRKAQIHEPVIVPGSAPGCGLSLSAFLPHSP